MGKREKRPAPPHLYNLSDEEDIDPPTDSDPTISGIIAELSRHFTRLQSANDRLICRLVALGVDENEIVDETNDEEGDQPANFESSPLLTILTNHNRQIARVERRNAELTALVNAKEAEVAQSTAEHVNVETPSTYDLFDLFGVLESDFDSSEEETSDSSVDDPINNPQPSTSTGITHPKPKKKRLSKRKFSDVTDDRSGVADSVLSQYTQQRDALEHFSANKRQKTMADAGGSNDSDDENSRALLSYVELLQFQEYMEGIDSVFEDLWEAEILDVPTQNVSNQEPTEVVDECESVEHPVGSSNHSHQLQSNLDNRDINGNANKSRMTNSTDTAAFDNIEDQILHELFSSANESNMNNNNSDNNSDNNNYINKNNSNKDDSPDSSVDSTDDA